MIQRLTAGRRLLGTGALVYAACVLGCAGNDGEETHADAGRDAAVAELDAGGREPVADAAVSRDASVGEDAEVEPLPDGPFNEPADFERNICEAGSLAGLDPAGVWHLDLRANGADTGFPFALRIEDGLEIAWGYFEQTSDVRADADDVFVRLVLRWNPQMVLAVFDACALRADGSIEGNFALCNAQDQCIAGTFLGIEVERIAGEDESDGLELVGEWGGGGRWALGGAIAVKVADGVAYLARYQDGLRILDVSDPEAPSDLGHAPTALPGQFEIYGDVELVDGPDERRYALMASSLRGVVPIDVTDPEDPVEVEPFPAEATNVHTLFVEEVEGETLAYLADLGTNGVSIWNVSDPEAPVELGEFVHRRASASAFVHDLYAEHGRAYLDYWELGLVVVDTWPDPSESTIVGEYRDYPRPTNHSNWVTTTSSGRKVTVMGDEDFTGHIRVVDVDEDSEDFMEAIGELQLRPEVSSHDMIAVGDRAYVAWYQDGVRVLDISDPTSPTPRAYINTWSAETGGFGFYEGATGLDRDAETGLLYVSESSRGLLILRESGR